MLVVLLAVLSRRRASSHWLGALRALSVRPVGKDGKRMDVLSDT